MGGTLAEVDTCSLSRRWDGGWAYAAASSWIVHKPSESLRLVCKMDTGILLSFALPQLHCWACGGTGSCGTTVREQSRGAVSWNLPPRDPSIPHQGHPQSSHTGLEAEHTLPSSSGRVPLSEDSLFVTSLASPLWAGGVSGHTGERPAWPRPRKWAELFCSGSAQTPQQASSISQHVLHLPGDGAALPGA